MAVDKSFLFVDKRRSYTADESADWEAGQIAVLASDASGGTIVTLAQGLSSETPIGMFWGDKVSATTAVEQQNVAFVDVNSNPSNGPFQLRGTSVVVDAERVWNVGVPATKLTRGVDYELTAGGAITRLGGAIVAGSTVTIRYRRNITAKEATERRGVDYNRGSDATEGNGLATVLQADNQLKTDQYDATQAYAVNDGLSIDTNGRLTSQATGSVIFAKVIEPPSATNPMVHVEFGLLMPA